MSAMKSDLAESLADFKTAIARNEAAIARYEAANERLRTDIEKNSKWQIAINLAAIAVATGFLALWAQFLLRPGG